MAIKLKSRSGNQSSRNLSLKKIIPKEYDEQCQFVAWFKIQFQHVRIAAIPNGMRTSIGTAIKAKKEGLSSGFPDLTIPAWNCYIEMKRQKGGVLSPEQKEWHRYLEDHCDAVVIVAKGCDDAIRQIMGLGKDCP